MLKRVLVLVGITFLCCFTAHADERTVTATSSQQSLYARLGRYDAIAAVTDDFLGRLFKDPALSRFFIGLSLDTKNHLRQHAIDLICSVSGGPCVYVGRDMRTAHAGLGINELDWNAAMKDLTDTMLKFKIPQKEEAELLTIVSSLKDSIVQK